MAFVFIKHGNDLHEPAYLFLSIVIKRKLSQKPRIIFVNILLMYVLHNTVIKYTIYTSILCFEQESTDQSRALFTFILQQISRFIKQMSNCKPVKDLALLHVLDLSMALFTEKDEHDGIIILLSGTTRFNKVYFMYC